VTDAGPGENPCVLGLFRAEQDWHGFYEDRPLDDLMEHSALAEAKSVAEFGARR
jgi:hypothetical protein